MRAVQAFGLNAKIHFFFKNKTVYNVLINLLTTFPVYHFSKN